MSVHQHSLNIIVPCFNPDPGWEHKFIQYYQDLSEKIGEGCTSLILVNDGSTTEVNDGQIDRIKAIIPEMKYLQYPNNKGKGHALRTGIQNSKSEFTIFTDVDFPYETDSVVEVYRQLCNGTDIVLGYREQDYYAKVPLFRKLLSKGLRWVLKSLLKLSITDTQCGLKGFNESGKKLFLATTIDRFLFDLEFVMLSSKDTTISTAPVLVKLREGVIFSKVNMKVLLVELANLFVLTFYKRKPSPHA